MTKMKKQKEQSSNFSNEKLYLIAFAITVIQLFFVDRTNEQSTSLFYLSLFTFAINIFLFFKSRFSVKLDISYKIRIVTLFSLSASIWLFFHCLFSYFPALSLSSFILINKITKSISDLNLFNGGAVSFFLANATLLIIGLIEFIINRKKIISFYKNIYIISFALCFYIILNYVVLFPRIITAKPLVELTSNAKTATVNTNQNWNLYFKGKRFEINYDSISYEWYYNGNHLIHNKTFEFDKSGSYQLIMKTDFGVIKSQKINIKETRK